MEKTVNLGLLGIAKKAGYIVAGEEMVSIAVKEGKAKLVLVASDTGESSKRKVSAMLDHRGTACLEIPTGKIELGAALGRGETGIVAVTDIGIAASFAEKLKDLGGVYAETFAKLDESAKKAKQRRKESGAHGAGKGKDRRRTKH